MTKKEAIKLIKLSFPPQSEKGLKFLTKAIIENSTWEDSQWTKLKEEVLVRYAELCREEVGRINSVFADTLGDEN